MPIINGWMVLLASGLYFLASRHQLRSGRPGQYRIALAALIIGLATAILCSFFTIVMI